MATHSSVLAWRIPGKMEPDGLPSRVAQSQTRLKRLSSSSDYITSSWRPAGMNSFWCLCQKLSLSSLYFNKTLLHKSSELSSFVPGPGLNSSPPEAKNPGIFAWFRNSLSPWGLIRVSSGQDGPDNLCKPTSADSKNTESAIWSSRQCHPVLGSLLCSISQSNCWVCGAFPSSSVEGFPWWTSPLQGKDFLQVCKYLRQLMTSNNLKMDWCNYGHNMTFNFDFNLF